jgi:hypothetical protein
MIPNFLFLSFVYDSDGPSCMYRVLRMYVCQQKCNMQ